MKIIKSDGAKLAATDIVAPTHDFFGSLISGVEVSFNGYPISSSGKLYGYKHHLFNLLTYGAGYKSSILSEELYFPDSKPNKFVLNENEGFKKRQELAALSAEFECIGSINEAIFKQQRYVPGDVNLQLTLRRNDPKFCLVSSDANKNYKVVISEAVLYIKRHVLSPEVQSYHQTGHVKYIQAREPGSREPSGACRHRRCLQEPSRFAQQEPKDFVFLLNGHQNFCRHRRCLQEPGPCDFCSTGT
jgi:hypothetical protein